MPNNGHLETLPAARKAPLAALLAVLCAVLTAGSVTMIGFTSFTAFNPPGWLRIVTMAPLPFVLLGSVAFAIAALKNGFGRPWAILALLLDGVAISAFLVMLSVS